MYSAFCSLLRRNNFSFVRSYGRSFSTSLLRCHSYDPDGKTTIQILNKNPETLMIDSYSQIGFRLNNGVYILGPMVIFPRSVLSWNIDNIEDVNEDSLSLFGLLEPKLDMLVLGVGEPNNNPRVNKQVISFMIKNKINVEVLPTEQACATFNFLNAESRYVAGAIIPPSSLRPSEEDILLTQLKHKKLMIAQDD